VTRLSVSFLLLLLTATSLASAQPRSSTPPAAPRPGEVETAPIRCWWRTDRTSIRIGERFNLTLTCSVIETNAVTVVPQVTQLDPGALQITPFEVVGGSRRDDVLSPPWRYLQYDYTVRLLGEGFFGQDAIIPALTVTYTIRAASGNGIEGRDLPYVLPAIPMRVVSLVPREAGDIRDATSEGFATIESRQFRARAAFILGTLLLGAAGILLIIAIVRLVGRNRERGPAVAAELSPFAIMGGVQRTIAEVRRDVVRDGWTPAAARRASAALRIAAAVGLGRPVAQGEMSSDDTTREGQLEVRSGLLRRKRVYVSAAPTAQAIAGALSGRRVPAWLRPPLETLRMALDTLGGLGYGRTGEPDLLAMNSALDAGESAVKTIRTRVLIPRSAPRPASRVLSGVGGRS